ncbi:hypothetical protein [Streptomyces sp. NPDC059761]|uniref:hypothetical protein n=1 Tax=Streptomyces sp. NPDC059761 TaxID=3346937 RepID=UPI00366566CF
MQRQTEVDGGRCPYTQWTVGTAITGAVAGAPAAGVGALVGGVLAMIGGATAGMVVCSF